MRKSLNLLTHLGLALVVSASAVYACPDWQTARHKGGCSGPNCAMCKANGLTPIKPGPTTKVSVVDKKKHKLKRIPVAPPRKP